MPRVYIKVKSVVETFIIPVMSWCLSNFSVADKRHYDQNKQTKNKTKNRKRRKNKKQNKNLEKLETCL